MIPLIDKNAPFREMEKASWYNNADRDEVAEELVLNAPIIEVDTDTVSRQAAIEAVEFGITHAKAINKETGEVVELFRASNNELRKAVDRIKQLPPSPSRPQWIPCTERLPEKPENYPNCEIRRTYYIVSLESGCVKALAYEFDRDEWQHTGSPVTAWMPLPEPYHNS